MVLGDDIKHHLSWCTKFKRPCIFITDLRRIPFKTYIKLDSYFKSEKCDVKIVIAGQNLFFNDYGNDISFFTKLYRVFYLTIVHRATIKFNLDFDTSVELEVGCRSSAVSLTRNENISRDQDSLLFEGLEKLAANAMFCSKWAKKSFNYDVAFVFNGRLASSLPVRIISEKQGIPVGFIEYGFEGLARVYPFSPHFNKMYPSFIKEYWETSKVEHSKRVAISLHYMKLKMLNRFTNFYKSEDCDDQYDFTFFVNSNDEYVSILQGGGDEKLKLVDQIEILDQLYFSFPKSRLCVRCHPNMRFADKSFELNLKSKCQSLGIKFFASDDNISSYNLIIRSNYIVVGTSSIALDASLLGAKVIVVGEAKYKFLLGIEWDQFINNRSFNFDILNLHKFCFFSANFGFSIK